MENNLAFIDGQNLYMGTSKSEPYWNINLTRFRIYLQQKYSVTTAYYYLGFIQEGKDIEELYEEIQSAGFILVFRQHNTAMLGKKKGNVDTDIVFSVMKRLYKKENFDKIILVSGDGDYKMLIDFLVEENKLKKILFPNKKFASSLYKKLGREYFDYLEEEDIRKKIEYKKEKGSLGN